MAPFIDRNNYHTSFGGSAGREGTAVQMGGAADQFTKLFALDASDRKQLLYSVLVRICICFRNTIGRRFVAFIEVLYLVKLVIEYSIFIGLCCLLHCRIVVQHTYVPLYLSLILCFIVDYSNEYPFGFAAVFSRSTLLGNLFSKQYISPTFIGRYSGASFFYFTGTTKFMGLGVPVIVDAFTTPRNSSIFY
jgi:hypothetical protein